MTYEEVLSAIHSRKTFSSGGASLERMRRLMTRLGDPQDQIKTIHVAGTNGKGSTCAMIESVLRTAGYRVGLFTSPYLVDFRERIQFDRENISKELLVECYCLVMQEELCLEQAGYEPINEFELVTAIGFLAFAKQQVDYAVIEVGLGGRYDATNVIGRPEVCCITPVSPDHTAVLGNTVSEIAWEKAGIIKPGVPVVVTRQTEEAQRVFEKETDRLTVSIEPESIDESIQGTTFVYAGENYSLPLLGRHQTDNAAAAIEVAKLLGIETALIQKGIQSVRWPGRLQYIPREPAFLIDAGHNPAGIQTLCEALETLFASRSIITVMAMMQDKDYSVCLPEIARRSKKLIASTVSLPRSLAPEALKAQAQAYCDCLVSGSVSEGIAMARQIAEADDLILVCGSVYAAGEAQTNI